MLFKINYGVNILLNFINCLFLGLLSFVIFTSLDYKPKDILINVSIIFVLLFICVIFTKLYLSMTYDSPFREFNQPILFLLLHFGAICFFVGLHLPYLLGVYMLINILFNAYHLSIFLKVGQYLETTNSTHYDLLQEKTIIQQTKCLRTIMKQDVYAKYQVSKKLINETKLTKQDREELLENLDNQFRLDLINEVKKVASVDPEVVMKKELRAKTIQESKESRLRLEKTFREVHEKLD